MHVYVSYKSIYVVLVFAVHYNFTLLVLLLCLVWRLFTTSEITLFITFKLIFTHPYHDTLQLYVETCINNELSVCLYLCVRPVCLSSRLYICTLSWYILQLRSLASFATTTTHHVSMNQSDQGLSKQQLLTYKYQHSSSLLSARK